MSVDRCARMGIDMFSLTAWIFIFRQGFARVSVSRRGCSRGYINTNTHKLSNAHGWPRKWTNKRTKWSKCDSVIGLKCGMKNPHLCPNRTRKNTHTHTRMKWKWKTSKQLNNPSRPSVRSCTMFSVHNTLLYCYNHIQLINMRRYVQKSTMHRCWCCWWCIRSVAKLN